MVVARRRAWLVGSVETNIMAARAAIHKVALDQVVMANKQGMVAHNEVTHLRRRDIESAETIHLSAWFRTMVDAQDWPYIFTVFPIL